MAPKKDAAPKADKPLKDTNAPTKPQSAYMLWSQANRASVRDANPNIGFEQMGKELGAAWNALSDAQKKPWNDKAAKAKAAYETALAAYMKTPEYHAFQAKKAKAGGKAAGKAPAKEKKVKGPKKPMSAYNAFSKAKRTELLAKNPKLDFGEINKLTSEAWKTISPADKKPFEDEAKKDKARYEKEMGSSASSSSKTKSTKKAAPAKAAAAEEEDDDEDGDDDDDAAEDDDDDDDGDDD